MASDFEEQLSLHGGLPSRPESPALEGTAAAAIEAAFKELIERRYLYQKIDVETGAVDAAIKEAVRSAQLRACEPRIGGGSIPQPVAATPERLKNLHDEIARRPWRLATHHMGDNPQAVEIHRVGRIGGQPVGTPIQKLNIGFYLPAVQLRCPGRCKGATTFIALVSSSGFSFDSPYPRETPKGSEQIFTPIYRCEMCRDTIYTILIRRVGLRLHLCGFAPRREPLISKAVPEALVPILGDAEQAVAEGDIFAGFYHLRTMLEHYIKSRLEIPLTQQVRGDELVARHYEKLPPGLGSVLPSLSIAMEKLSEWLHTRTGDADGFRSQRDAICKHIDVLTALGDTCNPGSQSSAASTETPSQR